MADEFRYGDEKTIHRTGYLNVETDEHGIVVSVWFRCMMLPFKQTRVGPQRAAEMLEASETPALRAVIVDGR